MNYEYNKFARELSIMADDNVKIAYEGENLVLDRSSSAKEEIYDKDKLFNTISHYFLPFYEHVCKKSDIEKLEKIKNKLIHNSSNDEAMQKKISSLFDDLIHRASSSPKKISSKESLHHTQLALIKVANPAENIEEFKKNLALIMNHYPRFQLGENLAVYDTAFGNFPHDWNKQKIDLNFKAAFENFRISLSEDSEKNKESLDELNGLQQICNDIMKPVIPVQMGLVIETQPLEATNRSMLYHFYEFIAAGKPVIINRYLLTAHEKILAKLNSDIYVQKNGSLCVIIPQGQKLEELGFSSANLEKTDINGAKSTVLTRKIAEDLKHILIDSTEKGKFERLLVYVGHGSSGSMIAGLSIKEFQKGLEVLKPAFVFVQSCFSGRKVPDIHLPDETIPCPVFIRSSFDMSSKSSPTDRFPTDTLQIAEKLLFCKTGSAPQVFPRQMNKALLQLEVSKLSEQTNIHNLPQILMPAPRKDIPKVSYRGFATDEVVDVSKEKTQIRKQGKVRNLLLFSEPIVRDPLLIPGTLPTALLSKGGSSHHFIEHIEAPDQELEKIAEHSLNAIPLVRGNKKIASKAFFIGKMNCKIHGKLKHLQQVVIKNMPDSREVIYKIEGKETYHRMKFVKVTRPKENTTWKKQHKDEILSPKEAIYEFYAAASNTKPSQRHLLTTTGGRQKDADFIEALEEGFWKSGKPLEADLFSAILYNPYHFTRPSDEKKEVLSIKAFDQALSCFQSHFTGSDEDKQRTLQQAFDLAKALKKIQMQKKIVSLTYTPLMSAVKNGTIEEVKKVLKEKPESLNALQLNGSNALMLAIARKKMDIVKLLIEHGVEMNLKNRLGTTPLSLALESGDDKLLSLMLDKGLNVKGEEGGKKLLDAMKGKQDMICQLLIEHQAGIFSSLPLLWEAAYHSKDDAKILAKLLEYPYIYLDYQDELLMNSPLHLCIHHRLFEGIKLLLEKKANPNLKNSEGWYPIHYAVIYGENQSPEIIDLLCKNSVNLNAQDAEGNTALHLAITKKNIPLIKKLIQKGASLSIENKKDKITPFELAAKDLEILKEILAIKEGGIPFMSLFSLAPVDEDIFNLFIEKTAILTQEEIQTITKKLLEIPYAKRLLKRFFEKFVISKLTASEMEKNPLAALHLAIFNQNIKEVEEWLKSHPKPEKTDFFGIHVLQAVFYFAKEQQDILIPMLLKQIQELNIPDAPQYINNNLTFIKLFKDAGYDFSRTNGTETLYYALTKDPPKQEIIDFLIQIQAGKNDPKFGLLLRTAFQKKREDWVEEILKYPDMNINQLFYFFWTPLIGALKTDDEKTVDLILSKDPDPNFTEPNIFRIVSPLHFLAASGKDLNHQIAFAKKLLDRKASINITDKNSNTPLHEALKSENFPLAKFLIENGADFNLLNSDRISALQLAEKKGWSELVHLMNAILNKKSIE